MNIGFTLSLFLFCDFTIGFKSVNSNEDEQNILTMELKLIEQKLMGNAPSGGSTELNKVSHTVFSNKINQPNKQTSEAFFPSKCSFDTVYTITKCIGSIFVESIECRRITVIIIGIIIDGCCSSSGSFSCQSTKSIAHEILAVSQASNGDE